jgi:hypothetical protein
MEGERDQGWLGPWILVPALLLAVMIFATFLLPSTDCYSDADESSPGSVAFAVIAALSAVGVGAAAVYRVVAMWRQGSFTRRDSLVGGLALLAICVVAALPGGDSEDNLAWALIGGFLLMVVTFIALLVAAAVEKNLDEVGALVPLYLFGAALTYPLIAWFVLEIKAGAFC